MTVEALPPDALDVALRVAAAIEAVGGAYFVGGGIFFLPLLTKVDLFALGSTPYDEVEFSRRRAVVGSGTLDTAYLERWASALAVSDLLRRAQEQASREG
jgi:hypothetical protein